METIRSDFLVIGSGLAGLTYALRAAEHGTVCVVTKDLVTESNTRYAQGGIAAAVGEADSWRLHEADTLTAGGGLCDPQAVRFLVQHAPQAIEWLTTIGAHFDMKDGELALGREGGHGVNRIVHHQDRTGWEVERAISEAVHANERITVFEHTFVTGLCESDGCAVGAVGAVAGLGQRRFEARATMLATGGCGRMYQHTTNPSVATGDGIALASGIGADIQNMEFMQFHPTTLYHPQMRSFLISEAVRGAGATLRNHHGSRFMYGYDDRLELAPRDVVARAIDAEMKRLSTWCVYLDLAHLERGKIVEEFPTIYERLASIGIQIERDWIPVTPAQHYSCGGVATDLDGQTSVPGLYAAGEVACTGVHGANRLASNSLLEAIVFSTAAAHSSAKAPARTGEAICSGAKSVAEADAIHLRHLLQRTMTDYVGIVRSNAGLATAAAKVRDLLRQYDALPDATFSRYSLETRNLLVSAQLVVEGAQARKENAGLHYNIDLIQRSDSS